MRRQARVLTLFAVLALAGCGGDGGDGEQLVGAGSTFVYPLVAKWIPDYEEQAGVLVTYGPIGSGGGVEQLVNRTVDFGASDAPLTRDQERACGGCVQIPWALAGTSIAYNVPGAPQHLKLTGEVLADIFLGKVERWNASAVAKLNPGAELPGLAITPIYRSDSSGTTYNLTDYLSRVSPEWKSKVGTGTSVDFPTGAGGKGSSGVSAALSRTEGGITYVDVAYSVENKFAYAALRNRAGSFELPDRDAVAAAAAAITSVPASNAVSIVDPPAAARTAYPLSTFTYALVPKESDQADMLKPFLRYAIGPGQQFAPDLEFAELPAVLLEADRRAIDGLKSTE
jgi:phosphate transport system substrate-binding protein